MDQYLLDNVARYQTLLQRFKPPPKKTTSSKKPPTNSSIIVNTRIRPLLQEEVSLGQVVATFPRGDGSGFVDLHELRRVVRGLPTMNVSFLHFLINKHAPIMKAQSQLKKKELVVINIPCSNSIVQTVFGFQSG
jgi:hypothetical protein